MSAIIWHSFGCLSYPTGPGRHTASPTVNWP